MEALEYNYIKQEVLKLTGVDLNAYKSQQMQRRLNAYLLRSEYSTWPDYFRFARNNLTELSKLKDYLTINVTSFFRDRDRFEYLRQVILPELLRTQSQLRVWSAGCSRGHEPYSLAILLAEATGPYRHHQIIATDIDRSVLELAKAGGPFSKEELVNLSAPLIQRYFRLHQDSYYVSEKLWEQVTFLEHNLLTFSFPALTNGKSIPQLAQRGFDLIVCRNVVIYFTTEVKDQLYQHFYDMLRPGGILFVGGTEIVSKASNIGFETAGISFYRRNGLEKSFSPGSSSVKRGILGG
ncbi:MAG: protein-glutamate O-methyltransferase CheR [Chloroflexota bacterium]